MPHPPILRFDAPELRKLRSGKVREVFDLGDRLLFVASDRISAFDVIMDDGVPDKGRVLNQISLFWFNRLREIVPHHFLTADLGEIGRRRPELVGRSMIVRKTKPLPVECVVRGYLAGSGWKEYRKSRSVCGLPLPEGLQESSELPTPIFTPSTKAEVGHDENISFETAAKILGAAKAEKIRDLSLAIYAAARDFARARGILIADTKFEFGELPDGTLLLIDEALTPDSSRFWPVDHYAPGRGQPSFDKQFLRDYLESLDWNKQPPPPPLPAEVIGKTREKYLDVYRRLVGKDLA
ncbi:MAG: phosphoribosylaminoimidazolesuccinocarboxamide synthase [Verrucomicrobiae bacterium]|nr:phosphoribosylaminoimidazolesuccinocarboxamide synthase [Verrucomicrobiae bacterium]